MSNMKERMKAIHTAGSLSNCLLHRSISKYQKHFTLLQTIKNQLDLITKITAYIPSPFTTVKTCAMFSQIGLCGSFNQNISHIVNQEHYDYIMGNKAKSHKKNTLYNPEFLPDEVLINDTTIDWHFTLNGHNHEIIHMKMSDFWLPYNPNPHYLLEIDKNFIPLFFKLFSHYILTYNFVNEQNYRIGIMQRAQDNCTDLLAKLKRDYNNARKNRITAELAILSSSDLLTQG